MCAEITCDKRFTRINRVAYQTLSPAPRRHIPRPGKRSAAGRAPPVPYSPCAGWRLRLIRPTGSSVSPYTPARQAQRRRAGHLRRHTCLCAGWRLRLIRPTASFRKPTAPPSNKRRSLSHAFCLASDSAAVQRQRDRQRLGQTQEATCERKPSTCASRTTKQTSLKAASGLTGCR